MFRETDVIRTPVDLIQVLTNKIMFWSQTRLSETPVAIHYVIEHKHACHVAVCEAVRPP